MQQITLKGKKKLYALLALIALTSTAIPIIGHADPAKPILSVEPYASMGSPGQEVKVDIAVTNITDLAGFEFNMTFDPAILNVTDIDMGPLFPPAPPAPPPNSLIVKNQSWWYDPNFEQPLPPGRIWFAAILPPPIPEYGGKSGNGTVAIITFRVRLGAKGESPLDLWGTVLGDSFAQPIDHEAYDGRFSVQNPIADFEYSPSEPHVGDEITFDASKSYKAGGTIESYEWDFGDGTIENLTDVTTTYTYSEAGDYTVKLTVKDNFDLKGSLEKDITVLPPAIPRHDVAISSVNFVPNIVDVGGEVSITVVAKNNGTFTETFDVSVYYGETQIPSPKPITDLGAGKTQQLSFTWNTAGVSEGLYEIKAEASAVEGESDADKANNVLSGGTVRVRGASGLQNIYLYAGAVIGIGAVAVLAFYLLKIRKPKAT